MKHRLDRPLDLGRVDDAHHDRDDKIDMQAGERTDAASGPLNLHDCLRKKTYTPTTPQPIKPTINHPLCAPERRREDTMCIRHHRAL